MTPLTNMRSLLIALAKAMNLINPNMQHHHEQTAYIAYQIGYEMSEREYTWMDVALNPSFLLIFTGEIRQVSLEEAVKLTRFMSRIIDFRSAWNLHDVGKLAVPNEILEKPGKLTDEEFNIVKEHLRRRRCQHSTYEGGN